MTARASRVFVVTLAAALACLFAGALTGTATAAKPDAETHTLSRQQARALAKSDRRVAAEVARHEGYRVEVTPDGPGRWKLDFRDRSSRRFAEVQVDESEQRVVHVYTGDQLDWQMARGIPGAFGRQVNALYVWVPLMCLFFFAFFDWRRPFRLLHLDLLALLSFSLSQVYFNRGQIDLSVPLAYVPLVYLLARMLCAVFVDRLRPRAGPVPTWVPIAYLAIALLFLLGFRIGLNVNDSNVIDVGYSGVVGADRITHGDSPYGSFPDNNPSGDTYGPVAYFAYVPAELVAPWGGSWDDLPAAHISAVAFDLLTVLGLFLVGRRLRQGRTGIQLGLTLAFAWASYPYTLLVMNSNANDSLVAALLVYAYLLASSRGGRGVLLALASATKFVPVLLAPLFAGYGARRLRDVLWFALGFLATLAAVTVVVLPDGGPVELWDRTLGFQLERESPFSIWGQLDGLGPLHSAVKLAALALAALVALLPRKKTLLDLAALCAAVLIAAQLAFEHWFYLYIVWWLPFALIALIARPSPRSATARLP